MGYFEPVFSCCEYFNISQIIVQFDITVGYISVIIINTSKLEHPLLCYLQLRSINVLISWLHTYQQLIEILT